MAVPGPPFWAEQWPIHFHQGHEASSSTMRQLGIRLILYLNDMLIMDQDRNRVEHSREGTRSAAL